MVCPCPERKARPEIGSSEGCPEIVRIGRVVCPHNGRVCPEARVYQRKDLKGKDLFLEFGGVPLPREGVPRGEGVPSDHTGPGLLVVNCSPSLPAMSCI